MTMPGQVKFAWLEITGKCQLTCTHCYADSGPKETHGQMQLHNWQRVLTELAGVGVQDVQFIGGEPTLHPGFTNLVRFALDRGLTVEVFSNLARTISPKLWDVFQLPGVRIATSYYSDQHKQHDAVTGRMGSGAKTLRSISEALRRGIDLRVGIIGVQDGQRVNEAHHQLVRLGVRENRIGLDFLRGVGRGASSHMQPTTDQLCGQCASGVIAISPTGEVWPCVFSRWLPVGNVLTDPVGEILAGEQFVYVRSQLQDEFIARQQIPAKNDSDPDICAPDAVCNPTICVPPCEPSPPCIPKACQPMCTPTCNPQKR